VSTRGRTLHYTKTTHTHPHTDPPPPTHTHTRNQPNPDSEAARKKAAADRLRAAERFMVVGTGEATCGGCGYEYTPNAGDPEYPVPPGTLFPDLPEDWGCPVCGAGKSAFRSRAKEIAGFAENQRYGLGTNGLTGGQKSGLIYGALALFFLLFISGYFLD